MMTCDVTEFKTDYKYLTVQIKTMHLASLSIPEGHRFALAPGFENFLRHLKDKRPNWTFKADYSYIHKDHEVTRAYVFEDNQALGSIYIEKYETKKSPYRYNYNNDRLEKLRSRGWVSRTCDIKKATAEITKHFHPVTVLEKLLQKKETGYSAARALANKPQYTFRNEFERLFSRNKSLVMSHWSTLEPIFPSSSDAHTIPDLYEKAQEAEQMEAMLTDTQKHHFILVHDDKYIDGNVDGAREHIVYTDATLPDHLRMGLGMLKLAPVHTIIPGIGVRTDEDSFIVAKEIKQ